MEQNRNEELSNHLQRTFRSWKGSLNFLDGCANGEPSTVLLALLNEVLDRDEALNEGLELAAAAGHEAIVRLCKDWGAVDFDVAMTTAARNGHESIVRLCKEWGATNFYEAMAWAHGGGYISLAHLCEEWANEALEIDDEIDDNDILFELNKLTRIQMCNGFGGCGE
jgi:hypothetical protein